MYNLNQCDFRGALTPGYAALYQFDAKLNYLPLHQVKLHPWFHVEF